ncbi:trypsin-1-like [Schistocerca gregaria]|uniref:trypsin-1-like n=1 Tax=Schistocerca gregaria TaxID=7010 RepID=UPI00211F1619|nr:trypsin-1-like [Schistocerca gregaria]
MLRQAVLLFALAGCVLGVRLPLRRVVHTGPARALGPAAGRIYGGQDAYSGQFPYQVSLQLSLLFIRAHNCGGSIVSTTAVVTAGHCVMNLGTYYAVAGELNLEVDEGTEQESRVSEQIMHPDYPGGLAVTANDIAVFTLRSAFTLGTYVQTIPLASAGSIPASGSNAIASGWGSTPTATTPNILQWLDATIIDWESCRQLLDDAGIEDNPVVDTMICTGPVTGGISLCSGDSGGPLVQNGELIGVTSWAITPCGSVGSPSGFTRVSAFNDFINQYL